MVNLSGSLNVKKSRIRSAQFASGLPNTATTAFTDGLGDRQLRSLALFTGRLNGPSWVDYFCFSRDLYYRKMQPFLIARNGWDPWLTW